MQTTTSAPPVPSSRAGRDWLETQRLNLQRLTDSVLIRKDFNPAAKAVARSVDRMLATHAHTQAALRETSVALFADEQERRAGLSLRQVAAMALELYVQTRAKLPPRVRQSLGGLSAEAVSYENRAIRRAAQEIMLMARALQQNTNAELKAEGDALWLSSSLLSVCAPPADPYRVNECIYCHRHTRLRAACKVHRAEGRYTVPLQQRHDFANALAEATQRLRNHFEHDLVSLHEMLDKSNDPAVLQVLDSVAQTVLLPQTTETLAIASRRVTTSRPSLDDIVRAWHSLPLVDDEEGVDAARTSSLGLGVELFTHLVRLDAFLRMGGDKRRRSRASTPANMEESGKKPAAKKTKQGGTRGPRKVK